MLPQQNNVDWHQIPQLSYSQTIRSLAVSGIRSMESRPCASESQLLAMPTEILGAIMDTLAFDQPSLAALALVNSDCQRLSRPYQFAHFYFDYSPGSYRFILHLLQECQQNAGVDSLSPTIGACVRKITVRPDPTVLNSTSQELFGSVFGVEGHREELDGHTTNAYIRRYRFSLLSAIQSSLPHLEEFIWLDDLDVDKDFFQGIIHPGIKHLELKRVSVDPPLEDLSPVPVGARLRSLDLEIHPTFTTTPSDRKASLKAVSPFMEALLRRSAPILDTLALDRPPLDGEDVIISFIDKEMRFPKLRYLQLNTIGLSQSALRALFSVHLRHLQLPYVDPFSMLGKVLLECDPLQHLETLVVPDLGQLDVHAYMHFLEKHAHIRKLCMGQCSLDMLDNRIIPLLASGTFSHLRSLSLSWASDGMDEETELDVPTLAEQSLAFIGTMTWLEQLRFTTCEYHPSRAQWYVNHDILRTKLKDLSKLKKLAICGDTYHPTTAEGYPEGYYEVRPLFDDLEYEANMRPELDDPDPMGSEEGEVYHFDDRWERVHRNRMLTEAEKYASVLPSLEWLYCGQLQIMIKQPGKTEIHGTRNALPLSMERDINYSYLDHIFAMDFGDL